MTPKHDADPAKPEHVTHITREEVIQLVTLMIEYRFTRYDMLHGHLSPADGAKLLEKLKY